MSEPTLPPSKGLKLSWRELYEKAVTALFIAIFLGAAFGLSTYIWNDVSRGSLVRALGGVTQNELESTIKKLILQGPQGPRGPPGALSEELKNAVIAFDGQCPAGWVLVKAAVGSAIVGVGATAIGETGAPLGAQSPAKRLPTRDVIAQGPTPKQGFDLGYAVSNSWDSEPISRYVHGVKTALTPTYYPLTYCTRGTYSNFAPDPKKEN